MLAGQCQRVNGINHDRVCLLNFLNFRIELRGMQEFAECLGRLLGSGVDDALPLRVRFAVGIKCLVKQVGKVGLLARQAGLLDDDGFLGAG